MYFEVIDEIHLGGDALHRIAQIHLGVNRKLSIISFTFYETEASSQKR
jgi:hypothetical protein